MTAPRRRIAPRRRVLAPEWVAKLLVTGERPEEGQDGFDAWFGWRFCGEPVAGLPPADSAEGRLLRSAHDEGD
jgi:hypothetical protein